MLPTRGARRAPVLATAVLGAASLLGGCAGAPDCCRASAVAGFEVLDDGAAVTLFRTPEEALAAVRAACGDRTDVRIRVEWSDENTTTIRIFSPNWPDVGVEIVKRIAEEAE